MHEPGLTQVSTGLQLPLHLVGELIGDVGRGPSVPSSFPHSGGVVSSRKGRISCHSHDLRREFWQFDTGDEWCHLFQFGDEFFFGLPHTPGVKSVLQLDSQGRRKLLFTFSAQERLDGITGRGALLELDRKTARYVDLSGKVLSSYPFAGAIVNGKDFFLMKADWGERLIAISTKDGAVRWEFRAEGPATASIPQPHKIGGGRPSAVPLDEEVLVSTLDGRIFLLDSGTGQIKRQGHLVHGGECLVTTKSIFCATEDYLAEFDHHKMKEIKLIDFSRDSRPLYGKAAPTLNGFCLTKESLIWTTMHGALMAISLRKSSNGHHRTWSEDLKCIMPIAVSPVCWKNYLYVKDHPPTLARSGRLLCYQGA